jgi:hypothetical protein
VHKVVIVRRSQHNLFYFSSLIFDKSYFFFVDVRHCFGLQETDRTDHNIPSFDAEET